MQKVFSSESIVQVSHVRNLLQTAGIACEIRNDRLSGALGEIPFVECWPELWVVDERDLPQARSLIQRELSQPPEPLSSWCCEVCGEEIEGQFAECWRCAAEDGETGAAT